MTPWKVGCNIPITLTLQRKLGSGRPRGGYLFGLALVNYARGISRAGIPKCKTVT